MLMKKRTPTRHAAGAPRDAVLPSQQAGSAKAPARGHADAAPRAERCRADEARRDGRARVAGYSNGGTGSRPEHGALAESLVGRTIGQYHIESIVGRGSMARVYKARHLGLGRHCALKVMDPALDVEQPGIRDQFWAEARAAANLIHPHVVTIHNLGSLRRPSLHRDGIRAGRADPARVAGSRGPARAAYAPRSSPSRSCSPSRLLTTPGSSTAT